MNVYLLSSKCGPLKIDGVVVGIPTRPNVYMTGQLAMRAAIKEAEFFEERLKVDCEIQCGRCIASQLTDDREWGFVRLNTPMSNNDWVWKIECVPVIGGALDALAEVAE